MTTEIKTNGYTADTAKHYLLNTGAIFKNVAYNTTSGKYEGEPLGATVGGAKFEIKVNLRQPEVDGVLAKVKGNDLIESVEATIEGTLKEWKKENISQALFGDITTGDGITAPTNYKIITGRSTILPTDYVNNICYVGKISGEDKPVIIMLKNAINTSGLSFEAKDKDEAGIPFKFEARADSDKPEDINGIWEIIYPETTI
ncbi:hypothetical protein M2651_05805 [Clostridium sp. SYSU_GA19001]|uniref:hypothetical protein n=1 Tax=Clostridium caldaquaticum TaxID=2940653 RepID=UPI00207786F0|nr:hypothetical protein [Clostridium caldaquaticum]MCM8710540.1 hypothetical protein [Clostridium caldaquaticum]